LEHRFTDDSLGLHTDLYQINMAETYWRDGIDQKKAVFELFFRKLPFDSGFAVFAGLEKAIEFLRDFRFTESDLVYLKEELGFKDDFLSFLRYEIHRFALFHAGRRNRVWQRTDHEDRSAFG